MSPARVPHQRPLKEDAVHSIYVQAKVGQRMGRFEVEQGGKVAGLQFKVNEQGRLVLLGKGRRDVCRQCARTATAAGGKKANHAACFLRHGHARTPPDQGGVELGLELGLIEVVVHRTAQGRRTSLESAAGPTANTRVRPAAADSPTIPALHGAPLDRKRGSPRAARAESGPADLPPAQAERHARTGSSTPRGVRPAGSEPQRFPDLPQAEPASTTPSVTESREP